MVNIVRTRRISIAIAATLLLCQTGMSASQEAVQPAPNSGVAVRVIGTSASDARPDEGPPSNLEPGRFQAQIDDMWRRSATFRRQCDRLAVARGLTTTIHAVPIGASGLRADTVFSGAVGQIRRADVRLSLADQSPEVIAHEIEHIIERLDGVDLRDHVVAGSAYANSWGYESHRAVEVGRRVAREMAATQPRKVSP